MRICAYCADIAGMRRQARGLADAVAALASSHLPQLSSSVAVVDAVAAGGAFGKVLPRVWSYVAAPVVPRPDMVVACGGASAAGALRARRAGAFVVYVQKPPLSLDAFDIVVCGMHDLDAGFNIDNHGNVITIAGSVGGVNAAMLSARRVRALRKFDKMPRPLTALILGGDNRAFSLAPSLCRRFVDEVRSANNGGTILASSSRRTSLECRRILTAANNHHNFHQQQNDDAKSINDGGGRFYYYDDGGDEEDAREHYYDILAAADRAVVSGDSVNMISEAATAAMPVYILPLAVQNQTAAAKFCAFHRQMTKRGAAIMWSGKFDDNVYNTGNADNGNCDNRPAAFDETARAAAIIWRRYHRRVLECQNNDGNGFGN